ncbi:hypothetical protein ACHHYP_07856 [Achlya hypogyna]|uniref:Uncharacterized protein n=1 Tax=Achlya hypogyna TaxID=1202772 RepID=A0A1V9ZLE4_ACHHY|nr:hypothetical protein ACHHYP_07856 [Achlya hypogyna]
MSSTIYDRQMKWKRYGEKKLALEARRIDDHRHGPCTFTPKTNRESRGRIVDASYLTHRAEIQAMHTHVARQNKARQTHDEAAKRAYFLSTNKDFDRTTAFKPFPLSTSNRTPRHGSSSPPRMRAQSLSPRKSESLCPTRRKKSAPDSRSPVSSNNDLEMQVQRILEQGHAKSATDDAAWDKYDGGVGDGALKDELKLREKAQLEATKIADKFSTAVLAFEERLVSIEQKNRNELAEMRKAMDRSVQSLALILQAMGLPDDGKPKGAKGDKPAA